MSGRRTTLGAAAVLGLTLLAPTTAATAAGETCRGEAATVVGTGPKVTGTEGRDVIVTNTAGVVDALGGDDLICVVVTTTNSNVFLVDAGPGNDVVDTTAVGGGNYVTTSLGAGEDAFVGGAVRDVVFGGPGTYEQRGADTELDRFDTGAGTDSVFSGSRDVANHDVVRLGDGDDGLVLGSPSVAGDAVLDAGAGIDGLDLDAGDTDVVIDMASSAFSSAAGSVAFTGFDDVSVRAGAGRITYHGTEGDDRFSVHPGAGTPTVVVTTGGGDDGLVIEPAALTSASRIDLGAGRDHVIAASKTGFLSIDLLRDVLTVDGTQVPAVAVEDARLMAPTIAMRGDDGDNRLTWSGCNADLRGGDGDDSLYWAYDSVFETYEFRCDDGRAVMMGDAGKDTLRSSGGDDRLIGGSGNDTVLGRGGDDQLKGGSGNDRLDGGEGKDVVTGGTGRDTLLGGGGRDTVVGGSGRDSADGSRGSDRCVAERERRCER